MPKSALPSRLSPLYLASKSAGSCFFLVALGVVIGVAWRCFFEPTRYRSQAQVAFTVSPAENADFFDWDGKTERWRAILSDTRSQDLLTLTLRHVVKAAATQDADLETERLGMELAFFNPARRYSDVLLDDRIPAWLTPIETVTRDDLVANMEPQALAAVVSDLNPPQGVSGWDFSFFEAGYGGGIESYTITNPGPEDRHFRVFYLLHELLNSGRSAATPEEAWRTAVREVTTRLERESEFGGGGFGHVARREIMREIAALPALMANGLYHSTAWADGIRDARSLWPRRWSVNFAMASEHVGGANGLVSAGMEIDLYPLCFPRDTVLTRITPLATATLLAYISATEKRRPSETVMFPPIAQPIVAHAPVPAPAASAPNPEPSTAIVRVAPASPGQIVDREAEARRKDRILALEEQLRRARLDRDAALRGLETARESERNLTMEALSARDRCDRLGEHYQQSMDSARKEGGENLTLESARILLARDAVLERLANLLQTCTEEHPFVSQARRELAAMDSLLAEMNTVEKAARSEEAREVRLTQLRREWDRAKSVAVDLDNRRRQFSEAGATALAAVTNAEDRIASTEAELAKAKDGQPAMITPFAPKSVPDPAPAPVLESKPEPEISIPPAAALAPSERTTTAPAAIFAALPAPIGMVFMPPPWSIPVLGGLLGLSLGILLSLARELAGGRFANAYQARHMIKLPILTALPAYDAKSFRAAAKTMRGEIFGARAGRMVFIPMPVDFVGPKPETRRDRLRPARRFPRIGVWIAALLFLALAGAIQYCSIRGIMPPRVPFAGDMSVPVAEDFDPSGSTDRRGWEELP